MGLDEQNSTERLPLRENTDSTLRTGELSLTGRSICQHLDLGRPSLQNCDKDISVVWRPPSRCSSVTVAQMDSDTISPTTAMLLTTCKSQTDVLLSACVGT